MATEDKNGIVVFQQTDNLVPIHSTLNQIGNSVSEALDQAARPFFVANITERSALVAAQVTPPSAARPLFVWRADAPAGKNYEYTANGVNWYHFASNAASYSVTPTLTPGSSSWAISNAVAHVDGRNVTLYFYAAYTGTITVGNTGNIANLQICTVPEGLRPAHANIPVKAQIVTTDQEWTCRFTSVSVINLLGGLPVNVNQTNPAFHVFANYMLPL